MPQATTISLDGKVRVKTLKDYQTYTKNPKRPTGLRPYKELAAKPIGQAVLPETGEMVDISQQKLKDQFADPLEYRKLYVNSFEILKKLSPTAQQILYYILKNLRKGSDEIFIDIEECMSFCGIKKQQVKTYYRGICDLLENELIFRRVGSSAAYFINPDRFFNGDRRKLIHY